MHRSFARLLLVCAFSTGLARAVELEGTRAPAKTECPSPEEAQRKMSVPEGYEVRCFAHEPMIVNPVAMTWDARGRLWVVEGYEYPEGSPFKNEAFGGEAKDDKYHPVPEVCKAKDNPGDAMRPDHPKIPKDRIVILEDTDNDGVADKRTVFLEGLDMGSAIICGDGGVYVGQQPHILHFKDTDGDDHADEWRVVLTGFGREDTHELVNSFCWGPDGWLYMTHGVFTHSAVRRPGEPVDKGFKFDAGLGRARPTSSGKEASWEFEVFADGTSNPWGADYDAQGNFFCSACVIDHFFHLAPGGIYARQGGAPENPYSYELLPSIVHHKHFRAAYAGVQVYQGGVYPKDTWGHAFIGNIHDNAVHEEILTPEGSSFKCEPRRDFLRANDGWFRPVSTRTGPDGNLWIMDWCDKYPCYQNAKANPEGVDRSKGRIWRVVYTNGKEGAPVAARPKKDMDLSKLSTPELVKTLEEPNNWMRRWARRELVERPFFTDGPKFMADAIAGGKDAQIVREIFWTLIARNDLPYSNSPTAIATSRLPLVGSPDPVIKSWLSRWIADQHRFYDAPSLATMAKNGDSLTRYDIAYAARYMFFSSTTDRQRGGWTAPESWLPPVIEEIMRAEAKSTDQTMAFAVWMAIEPCMNVDPEFWAGWLAEFAPKCQPLSRTIIYKMMRRLCDSREAKNMDHALELIAKIKSEPVLLAHALDGLEKGQETGILKPTKPFSALFAEFAKSDNADIRRHAQRVAMLWGDENAIHEVAAILLDSKAKESQRISTVQTLRLVKTDAVREVFAKVLSDADKQPVALTTEVIRATADLGGNAFVAPLLKLAASKEIGIRIAALGSLAGRVDWTHAMLDAIMAGKISAGGFPVSVRRQLATSGEKAVRDHAYKVLGAWQESDDNLKALIAAKKQACLEGEPDLAAGKLIFQTTCMVCHTFYGGGQKVGPELIGSGRSNLDAILANVIDPNQIIGNGYEGFIVTTKDNQTLMGRITEDTPSYVKLLAIGGAEQTIERARIAKLENTHKSLMPVGFGALPDDQLRNLIWYVLAPPDEGPLTKEKKKLLSTSFDAPAKKPAGDKNHAIDWESVSLWNPQWKVVAPEFDRTPVKLGEYYGRQNVLLMHPFPDKTTPAALERKFTVDAAKHTLKFAVAADDRGDWELVVTIDGKAVKKQPVDHEKPRWKEVTIDLEPYAGREVTVRLEGHPTGWSYEFGYWSSITLE